MSLALFDMDGTLIDGDTNDISFSQYLAKGLIDKSVIDKLNYFEDLFYKGILDINEFVRFAVTPLLNFNKEKRDLILDSIVITLAAICYKEIESALFAVVAIFISGNLLDAILYGSDKGRLIFIVTNKGSQVADAIFKNIDRGVTVLPSYGAYENKNNKTLICALKVNEVDNAIKTVSITDPNAFTVVTLTGGIFGRGFK